MGFYRFTPIDFNTRTFMQKCWQFSKTSQGGFGICNWHFAFCILHSAVESVIEQLWGLGSQPPSWVRLFWSWSRALAYSMWYIAIFQQRCHLSCVCVCFWNPWM